jgi:DNA-binding transcriptional LysR family regulator
LLPHQAFDNAFGHCRDLVLAVLHGTFHPGGEHMVGTPPFRKLEYLLAVARERHFGKAAERLHVDPSTLSRQIREVEQELGFDVFFRANHYVDITEEAAPFVPALEKMLARFVDEFESAKNLARLRARRKASTFVVGYSPFVIPTIPNQIRTVHTQRFSAIHLELRRASAQELRDSLIADACQACVMLRPGDRQHPEEIQLRSERLFAVWPRDYAATLGGAVALSELRAHPLVMPCSDRTDPVLHAWFFDRCVAAGFKPKVAAEASCPPEAFHLVQDGVGIAIVPGSVCGDAPRDLECSPIGGIEALQLILAWRRRVSHRLQKMVAEIANELRRANLVIAG